MRQAGLDFEGKVNSPESNREQRQSAACTPCLDDSGFAREDDATSEYWDNFGIVEESLPGLSLETSVTTQPEEPIITGRRVVSLAHFVNAVRSLDDHSCPKLTGRFALVKERRVGLWSELTFTCSECQEIRKLTTDPVTEPTSLTDKANVGVNDAAVWAFMSIGSGHSQFEEAMAVIEIPAMSKGAFLRREESLGKWHCTTSKAVTCKSPAAILKRYASKKTAQKANKESLRRKLFEENGHLQHKRKESTVNDSMIHYGPNCQQPDMPPEQYAEKERAVLASLQDFPGRKLEAVIRRHKSPIGAHKNSKCPRHYNSLINPRHSIFHFELVPNNTGVNNFKRPALNCLMVLRRLAQCSGHLADIASSLGDGQQLFLIRLSVRRAKRALRGALTALKDDFQVFAAVRSSVELFDFPLLATSGLPQPA
ncbi:hypothetical protein HPB51_027866 [Rhipicephalus microplus]|uniref:Mutator-like transposase domain-containing protein n=1 Tax=Rhipicephalus microplus TaxID=6941 RepID=A0A9J6CYW0_RHIMP|nr:hypothetical protein HPB51_027866 [Rhipicephalus microplus]